MSGFIDSFVDEIMDDFMVSVAEGVREINAKTIRYYVDMAARGGYAQGLRHSLRDAPRDKPDG